jgi:23S rRNA (uracil1939-C5)-methyltransferase
MNFSSRPSVVERLTIVGIGHRGDGLAEGAAGAIFVPGTLPGETVEVEDVAGHPDRRQLLRIETASPTRIKPLCPHFGVCGGCAVQHWEESHYRAWKRGLVVEALRQAGLDTPVADLLDAHGDGRRRAVFHARSGAKAVLEVGFAAARTHRIVAIDRCPVLAPDLSRAVTVAWALAEALGPTKKPLDIAVTATDAGLDVDVRGSGPLAPALMTELARLATKHGLARLTRHGELVAQSRPPTLRVGKAIVSLPPATFLQATAAGEAALARLALTACADAAKVADLFCGIGPFALRLAERSRVFAADADEAALGALKRAAATPGLKPIDIERRDLFRRPLLADELKRFDAVIFDPPRQGAEAQSRELAASRVPLIVAVSCNPATFARDVATLLGAGYRLTEVTPVDQFRYAAHVEIVARLER